MCLPLGFTCQMLPQCYSPSPTMCHGMVALNLSLFSFPTSVKGAHYVDDIMPTCEDWPLCRKPCRLCWTTYNREDGQWVHREFQVWAPHSRPLELYKTCIVTKYQPNLSKKCERGAGFCGNSGVLVNICAPPGTMPSNIILSSQVGTYVGLGGQTTGCLWEGKKSTFKQIQVLGISQAGLPSEFDISVTLEGMGWAFWHKQQKERVPLGFWTQL